MQDTIKILEYKDLNRKYTNEIIHNFVNSNMHKFIGKPLQQRQDVIKIQEYYLENGGNFWVAIDEEKGKIVGTIALVNRNDEGIVRRLYVDENYQSLGIGNRLYATLEEYAICRTDIKTLYLACGKVLKGAHKFYKKQGFIQTDSVETGMHFSEEDDYFKKQINHIKEDNLRNDEKRRGLLERVRISKQQTSVNEDKNNIEKLAYNRENLHTKANDDDKQSTK